MSDEEDYEEEYYYEEEDYGEEEEFYAEGSDMGGLDTVIIAPKPESLSPKECMERMRKDIQDLADLMCWKPEKAILLLRHYKWSKDRAQEAYFDNPDKCAKLAGVSIESENSFLVFGEAGSGEKECMMCWDDCPAEKVAHLAACDHWFCISCWYSNLKFRMDNEGGKSVGAPCLHKGCSAKCSEAVFMQVFPEGDPYRAKYERFLLEDYLTSIDKYCFCPRPGCDFTMYSPTGRAIGKPCQPVKCDCKKEFCFLCREEVHAPCDCAMLARWLKKEQDDSETANWFSANTKNCPKCSRPVEKNGGCNHMTCQQCGHDWCWVCEGPWSQHGSSYYKCNYYKPDEKKEKDKSNAADELQKYIHYYTRYRNHDASKKMDETVLVNTRRRIEQELRATQRSLSEVDYLEDTALALISCRHMLKYTYVFAYYMDSGSGKDLFEYNQSQLEFATELLSEFVEDRTGKYGKLDVVNRTSTARQMLKNLSEAEYAK